MSRRLEGVQFRRHWVTLVGALGGLLAAAGRDLPQTYLMGVTGHAFRLTLDLVISPSAPMELNFHEVFPLWENLGVWFRRVAARPGEGGFAETRDEVLARIRQSVDRGWPAIAYDLLNLPEYGLVVGYDEGRLACLTLNNEAGPEWMAVEGWPSAEHRSFTRAEAITLLDLAPKYDRRQAEVASLRFAVEHFWAPPSRDQWLQHGKRAYEFWAATLASPLPLHGEAPGVGHSYNLSVLAHARRDAAAYLAELAGRYPEAPALSDAAAAYGETVAALEEGTRLLPFPGGAVLGDPAARRALAECLRLAMAAEKRGVEAMERAMRALR